MLDMAQSLVSPQFFSSITNTSPSFGMLTRAQLHEALQAHLARVREVVREEVARGQLSRQRQADDVMTVPQCSAESGFAEKTIRKACASGALAASKPTKNSQWRVSRSDFETWLSAGRCVLPSMKSIEAAAAKAARRLHGG